MKTQILINFPKVLSTKRLTLNAHEAGDGKMINEAVRESYSQLKRWMPWAKTMPTVGQSEEFARNSEAEFIKRTSFSFGIHPIGQTNVFLGAIGIPQCDWHVRSFEIGYWCRKSCQGRGYITEAVDWLTYYLAEKHYARRVVIRCDSRNHASAAVAKRLDFKLEGCMRDARRDNAGKWYDVLVFAKTF